MKKTLAALILLFVMLTNLNATEVPTVKNDANCTVEKCKTNKVKDSNCSVAKCTTKQSKDTDCTAGKCKKNDCKDCDGKGCEKCKTNAKTPTWSASKDGKSSMTRSACCKNKKNKEEAKEKAPMKCAAGKCGGGK